MYKGLCKKLMLVALLVVVSNVSAMRGGKVSNSGCAHQKFTHAGIDTICENLAPLTLGAYYLAHDREAVFQNKYLTGGFTVLLACSLLKNYFISGRINGQYGIGAYLLTKYPVTVGIVGYALKDQIRNHPWMAAAFGVQFVGVPILTGLWNNIKSRSKSSSF